LSGEIKVLVYGDLLLDVLFYLERPSIDGRAHVVERAVLAPGGSAGNVSVALARLGALATLVSAVGADPIGQYLVNKLVEAGVDVRFVEVIPELLTGVTVGFVEPSGERTLYTFKGASRRNVMSEERLGKILLTHERFNALFISAYTVYNDDGGLGGLKLARELSSRGVRVAIDLGGLTREHASYLNALKGVVDYVFLNRDELVEITSVDDVEEGVEVLYPSLQPEAIFLKLGREGCMVYTNGRRLHVPAYRVPVVDTTGCGDVFNAGVIYGLLSGGSLEDATKLGSLLAAYKATGYGAQHLPKRLEELLEFKRRVEAN
jgi:ribokinase